MKQYELVVIFRPDLDPTDTKKRDAIITKILEGEKYRITETTTLGKKSLSYPILKNKEGIYVLVKFEAESYPVAKLAKQAKLITEILRYLLVVVKE